jgi:flagellar biogenesis protein FliO|tara:strand:+ start:405 stop:593 length:189 start_codon:yes stop_codon:yes gene_type:complete
MAKFFLKLLKYLLKFIDDLPIIGAARKFAEKNLETTLLIIFIIFIIYVLYKLTKQKKSDKKK